MDGELEWKWSLKNEWNDSHAFVVSRILAELYAHRQGVNVLLSEI